MSNMPKKILSDDQVYIGDNGRVFCGRHAGMTAKFTGRDLDGTPVLRVDAEVVAMFAEDGMPAPCCEECGALPLTD